MTQIKRASLGALACAVFLLCIGGTAGAVLTRDTPTYTQSFTNPGAVGVEGYGPLPYSFAWYADKPSSGSSLIYGYAQDHSSAAVQTTISTVYTDPEGEIGQVSGIALDTVNSMLYIADTEKNRILWYPRTSATLPAAQVNYAGVGQMPGPVSDSGAASGTDPGEFDGLAGITAYDTGAGVKVIAADKNNERIQIFTAGPSGLSAPVSVAMPTGAEPADVAVNPENGNIYVAMSGAGPEIVQVFSSAGADLGRFGNAIDAGVYNQIDWDPDKQVIYASTAARVDVISPQSREILGSYMSTAFSDNGTDSNREVKFMGLLGPTGQLFVARFDPAGVLNGGAGPEDPRPAQSFLTPNPPTCVEGAPLNASSGTSINFTPDCTDSDGSTNQEFMVVGVSRGNGEPASNFDSIDYTVPAGGGLVTLAYRVWTINGISPVYNQDIWVTDSEKVASEILPGRGIGSESFVGLIYNEGVGNFAKYLWHASSDGNASVLAGYDQTDAGGGQISAVDCSASSTAGELGDYVSGIAYTSNNQLLVADYSNSRVVAYTRQNSNADPVDCDGATSITSVSGRPLLSPRSVAQHSGTAYAAIRTFSDPDGGIVSFNPQTGTEINWVDYSGAGMQLGPLTFGGGHLFAGVNGSDRIEVLNPDLTIASTIGPLSSGTAGEFISLSAQESSNRLFAMKADDIFIFSLTSGRLLGKVRGAYWGNGNVSVSTVANYQQWAISNNDSLRPIRDFWSAPNPVCTPAAPITVAAGASVTFTPDCTDFSESTVREASVVNSQTFGSAAPTPDLTGIKYTAGPAGGQDSVTYRVQTQDGLSVAKTQQINVVAAAAPEEKPVIRETANLQLDSGDVFVKLPGTDKFVKLTEDMLIPIGTIIDATAGKAHITMANKDGSTYDGVFWDGIFQILQGSGNFPVTTMKLRNDLVGRTTSIAMASSTAELAHSFKAFIAKKKGKKKNGLWGDAKGKYKTSGKGGSAAVRGTIWYVADYQCGSLFKVKKGKVLVDPSKGRNFTLKAGKQAFIYFKKCVR